MIRRLGYHAYTLLWQTLDWIYPPECGGCSKPGNRWCNSCLESVEKSDSQVCIKCGSPLSDPNSNICPSCLTDPPPFKELRSYGYYHGNLRNALHKLKFGNDIGLSEVFSKFLIQVFPCFHWDVDLITAVPLGNIRARERGYNQSALIAFPLALYFGIPFAPKALTRIRETRSQVNLTVLERHENVEQAFHSRADIVKYKKVLIVDDIATTGATIISCTNALLKAGAQEIYGLTVAKTKLSNKYQPDG